MKRLLIFSFILFSAAVMLAQEITTVCPRSVSVGQRFQVSFEVNARHKDFQPPTFNGLEVLQGPWTGYSSRKSNINGKRSVTQNFTYTYVVEARKEGTITIGGATCVVEGQKIKGSSTQLKVVKDQSSPTRGGAYDNQQQKQHEDKATINGDALFARINVNKTNPYQGEQVIVTYKIYTQVSLHQYSIDKLPGNKGFWSEDLSEGKQIKQSEETINGRRYVVAEIRRGAIFGQETGTQRIAPLELDVLAMVPVQRRRTGSIWDLFDDPFFNQAQAVERHLTTNSLSLNVKPLPEAPAGSNFSGAVGQFKAKAEIDQTEVKANEAITLRLTVSGSGNLPLIEAPEVEFAKVFEVYDPKVNDKINRNDGGISGSRTFEWILIPQSAGNYKIEPIRFTYFNPQTGSYETLNTEGFEIKVAKGDGNDRLVSSNKSDLLRLNDDINHIKSSSGRLQSDADSILWWQWLLALLPILAAIVAIVMGRKHQALLSDEVTLRQTRAMKQARKRLRNAESLLTDSTKDALFYEEIYKALWGCLSDKYRIPRSRLNRETVVECLSERNINPDQLSLIMETLQSVDEARFAPGDSSARKHEIYNQTLSTIAAL